MINARIGLVDVSWSAAGDFILEKGDLQDTGKVFGLAFLQEVKARVSTTVGDWATVPNLGCYLDQMSGQPNNQNTANALQAAITYSLTNDNYLAPSDFSINVIPMSISNLLIRITFLGILTNQPINSKMVLNIVYDLTGKGPFIVR